LKGRPDLQPCSPQIFRRSNHAFSLVEAVELSRALHPLPMGLIVYGIEGHGFQTETGLSS
jgi:hypothetical protein